MDSLNLLFGLNAKMPRAPEKSTTGTAIVYMSKHDTTNKVAGMINELLMDDGKTRINPDEQKSADLSPCTRNI